MATKFETPTIVLVECKDPRLSATFRSSSPQADLEAAVKETVSRREIEEAETLKVEQQAEKAFLDKWDPRTPQTASSSFWGRTPSRLYWALSYNHFEDQPEKQLEMAKDLLAIYGDSANPKNTSLAHAMDFVKQHG